MDRWYARDCAAPNMGTVYWSSKYNFVININVLFADDPTAAVWHSMTPAPVRTCSQNTYVHSAK